jgi:hypothetical protein
MFSFIFTDVTDLATALTDRRASHDVAIDATARPCFDDRESLLKGSECSRSPPASMRSGLLLVSHFLGSVAKQHELVSMS